MKQILLLSASALLAASSALAQDYIKSAPEGGFKVADGKDYIVLYAPQNVLDAMGSKVITDNNLDETKNDNYLEYWVTDWDKKALTLYNVPEEGGINSFGGDEYINATPLYEWGTGVFMSVNKPYDLSKVTDKHHLHIGLRDFGSAPSKYQLSIGSQATIKTNGFQIQVGIDKGAADGDFVGVGSLPNGNDGKWYYLDIPVADLVDPNGDFGFEYDFSAPINDGVFAFSFKDPVCSTATQSGPEPGEDVYSYEVTKLGSALSIDHVFFYVPDSDSAIDDLAVDGSDSDMPAVYYDLSGRQVADPTIPGIYILKRGSESTKVLVK